MRLPQVSRRMTRDEVLIARGTADALALHRRYHNEATHQRYVPQGDTARGIYETMETARCEAMGARDMPGTAGNIDAKISAEADRKGYAQISTRHKRRHWPSPQAIWCAISQPAATCPPERKT